jgi:hypothetical protein
MYSNTQTKPFQYEIAPTFPCSRNHQILTKICCTSHYT